MSTKGQVLSYDFLTASVIFVLLAVLVFSFYRYTVFKNSEIEKINEITDISFTLSEIWLKEGTPVFWGTENVLDFGFSNYDRLNQTKLDFLKNIGYDTFKKKNGVGEYEFYMEIVNSSNSKIFSFGVYPEEPEYISKSRRLGILNSSLVFINTLVWQ